SPTFLISSLSLHDALPIFSDLFFEYALFDVSDRQGKEVEGVPDFMGYTGGELANNRELLGFLQLFLQFHALGQFTHHFIVASDEDRKSTRLNSSHVKISYA